MIRTTIDLVAERSVSLRVEADEPIPTSPLFWMFVLLEHDEESAMAERVLRGDGALDMEHEAQGDPSQWATIASGEIGSVEVVGEKVTIALARDAGFSGLTKGKALTTELALREVTLLPPAT